MLDAFIKDKYFFKVFINQLDCPLIYLTEGKFIEIANDLALNILNLDPNKYVGVDIQKHCLNNDYAISKVFGQNELDRIEETYTSDVSDRLSYISILIASFM